MEYEPDVPTHQEIHDFFCRIKSLSELDALAMQINDLLTAPWISFIRLSAILIILHIRFPAAVTGGVPSAVFQHMRNLTPRSKTDLQAQISLYKNIFPARERAHFENFCR